MLNNHNYNVYNCGFNLLFATMHFNYYTCNTVYCYIYTVIYNNQVQFNIHNIILHI